MDVKTLCLGVLTLGDATGYEIKKMFEDGAFGHFLEASYGSIYPALTKLTEEGLVSFRNETQDGRPDKKVYSITELGMVTFRTALLQPLAEDKYRSEFMFVCIFADLLPSDHMPRLIEQQIARYKQKCDGISETVVAAQTTGAQFVSGFGQALTEAAIEYLEANRHLIGADARNRHLQSAE